MNDNTRLLTPCELNDSVVNEMRAKGKWDNQTLTEIRRLNTEIANLINTYNNYFDQDEPTVADQATDATPDAPVDTVVSADEADQAHTEESPCDGNPVCEQPNDDAVALDCLKSNEVNEPKDETAEFDADNFADKKDEEKA